MRRRVADIAGRVFGQEAARGGICHQLQGILGTSGALAIAKVGYDEFLRLAWPLRLASFVVSAALIGTTATLS